MTARLLDPAQIDLLDLAVWYDQQTAGVGDQLTKAMDQLLSTPGRLPHLYGRVAGCPRGRDVREALVPGFPAVAVYEVMTTEVLVVSVVHGRSSRSHWRGRLP